MKNRIISRGLRRNYRYLLGLAYGDVAVKLGSSEWKCQRDRLVFPKNSLSIKLPQKPETVRRQRLLTLDQLTDIIIQGEQLDVEFKSGRRNMAFYGLSEDDLAKVEGKP